MNSDLNSCWVLFSLHFNCKQCGREVAPNPPAVHAEALPGALADVCADLAGGALAQLHLLLVVQLRTPGFEPVLMIAALYTAKYVLV